ncbi:MAG: site-specific DNA-methyltransferase [Firmicutes bacterium]|jgi:hypothetical protein|nr:site-specific DNA-methyltransferase [Bacillota bacterium]
MTLTTKQFHAAVLEFCNYGKKTAVLEFPDPRFDIPVYTNEFWTSKQRAAHSLHEISYRACFKPQLPEFFITRLTDPGAIVYDPFMGRGTTLIESALLDRIPLGCDINPLSPILTRPRFDPPEPGEIKARLYSLDLEKPCEVRDDILVFYHPHTLRALTNLQTYLLERESTQDYDHVDAWIRMVATNRLTGHSPGFFSVYTMPPNQAVSIASQRRINERRGQVPPRRDIRELILRKSNSLLRRLSPTQRETLSRRKNEARIITASADDTPQIGDNTVALVVTSPPFLNVVDYEKDNWLRCWFNGIDTSDIRMWQFRKPEEWRDRMTIIFRELRRILLPGGHVAFEVGEVQRGRILLETWAVPAAIEAGFRPEMVMINSQKFTKTAHCWGVDNLQRGTNTNRVILLRKPE